MTKREQRSRARARRGREEAAAESLQFSTVNAVLGAAGLLSLTLGYRLLAEGSTTLAPLMLVLGYVILLPLALIV